MMDENVRSPDPLPQRNWLDRGIAWINPEWGYRRDAWRNAERAGYNAGEVNRGSAGWFPVNAKAEQVNQPNRDLMRARAKDLERNSDLVGGPISTIERNVVATGFRVQALTGDEKTNSSIEEAFLEWQKPQNCDVTGAQAFWELCKMAVRRTEVDGGLVFVKAYGGNARFPFQLQAREVDDIDGGGLLRYGENAVVNGIEVDRQQKPVAYHLKIYSPDGWFTGKSERVPAKRVISLWRKTAPSQIREITPLAPAITRANDTEDYLDAISLKEKILASLSVFIKKMLPGTGPGRAIGSSVTTTDYDPKTGYKKKKIAPGMIMEMQPGDEVQSVIPTGQAANAKELVALHQRLIGSGQGLSYEAASRDMSQVNYSSARQGLLEDQRTYADWQQWLIDHFLSEVYTEFVISAVLSGELNLPGFWGKKSTYLKHKWIAPGWSWIDPLKEGKANELAIASGQDNLANVCARTGYDWKEVMEQRAREEQFRKELELKYGISLKGDANVAYETAAGLPAEDAKKGSGGN
ncbi:MAG: phage portal protein [Negativicutes bacterium]